MTIQSAYLHPTRTHDLLFTARRLRLFGAICLLWICLGLARPTQLLANEDLTQLSPEGERAALLINQLRTDAGLPPLRVHPLLTLAANQHIVDMTSSGVYGHTGSDGSSVRVRVARTGYVTTGWVGENWAVSQTVDKSIGWWMTDAPHRENVLNRSYTEMGLGTAPHPKGWGLILVVDFSTGNANGAEGYVPGAGQAAVSTAAVTALDTSGPMPVDSGVRYRVAAGDTLYTIGQRYGVSWQSIARLNGLGGGGLLQIGQELRIPGGAGAAIAAPRPAGDSYTVVAGDTLLGIAIRFGLEWQTLAAANGLGERSLLQIGDRLTIPTPISTHDTPGAGGATPAAAPIAAGSPSGRSHTVQAGETIWVIAARYGVDWQLLLQQNGLNERSLIQIGQVLRLP